MFRDDLQLSVGSGFLWSTPRQNYVVTAWHCLTGAHFATRQSLSPTGARPNKLRATFLTGRGDTLYQIHQNLRTDDDEPGWLVHPAGSVFIDVAVVPLALPLASAIINVGANNIPQSPVRVDVGSDLFIVGFPLGIDRVNLPIWKRASVAIEPAAVLDRDGSRHLIVDTATREGMSGSPVYARRIGGYISDDGSLNISPGTSTKFVGLYSGRLSTKDPLGAQLGIVWPAGLIEDIISRGVREDFH